MECLVNVRFFHIKNPINIESHMYKSNKLRQNVLQHSNPKTFLTHFSQQAMPLLSRLFKSTTSSENVMWIKVSDTKAKQTRSQHHQRNSKSLTGSRRRKKRCQPVNHTRLYVPHEKIKESQNLQGCKFWPFQNQTSSSLVTFINYHNIFEQLKLTVQVQHNLKTC